MVDTRGVPRRNKVSYDDHHAAARALGLDNRPNAAGRPTKCPFCAAHLPVLTGPSAGACSLHQAAWKALLNLHATQGTVPAWVPEGPPYVASIRQLTRSHADRFRALSDTWRASNPALAAAVDAARDAISDDDTTIGYPWPATTDSMTAIALAAWASEVLDTVAALLDLPFTQPAAPAEH